MRQFKSAEDNEMHHKMLKELAEETSEPLTFTAENSQRTK